MDIRRLVEAAIDREAERLASQASSPHVAALLRYACHRARDAADFALVMMMIEIPARESNPVEPGCAGGGGASGVHPDLEAPALPF